MLARAQARFLRMSSRKVRRVVELIKDKPVDEAIAILSFVPKAAAEPLQKTIKSATANALAIEGTAKLKAEDLHIKSITVDGGPTWKRIRPVGMGRAYRIRKRLCHLTVVVEGEPKTQVVHPKKSEAVKPVTKRKEEKPQVKPAEDVATAPQETKTSAEETIS